MNAINDAKIANLVSDSQSTDVHKKHQNRTSRSLSESVFNVKSLMMRLLTIEK